MLDFFRKLRPLRGLPIWVRYSAALGIVMLTAAVRAMLDPYLVGSPYLLFFPGVFVAAALFNRGSGVFTALVSAVVGLWFFIEPMHGFPAAAEAWFTAAVFLACAVFIAFLVEALHKALTELGDRTAALDSAVTELAGARAAAEAGEREADLLLQELAHRTRNDLAGLSTLLKLQARHVPPDAAEALVVAESRVQVLGRLHARLSRRRGGGVTVDACDFLTELVDDMRQSRVGARPVHLTTEAESLPLPLEVAGPVGLIVNELITNALKYAFPGDRAGTVEVTLRRYDGRAVLMVRDDGVGCRQPVRGTGLGTTLVETLARQLHGTFERTCERGTECRLDFPLPVVAEASRP